MANKFLTNLDLNLNELQNAKIQSLAADPSTGLVAGRLWYRSDTGTFNYYNGSEIRELGSISSDGGESQGTVTSVALSLPSIFTVSGSPITTKGTLSATLTNQSANSVFAAPDGSNGAPTFRKLVVNDIPVLSLSKIDGISATTTEINYLSGVTSSIQTQLNNIAAAAEGAFKSITLAGTSYKPADGVVTITAANLVSAIGNNAVARATADASGNNIATTYIKNSEKGAANGVATLDGSGLIPTGQLPGYVDDVIEAYTVGTALSSGWLSKTSGGSALTPETGKIYVIMSSGAYLNKQYRWSGNTYVLCNPSDVNSVNGKTGIVVLSQDDVGDTSSYVRMTPTERQKLTNVTVKYTATNSALTSSGGIWTWSIMASTHGISNNAMIVQVYEASTGEQVFPEITVNQSNYTVTIEVNDSNGISSLTAGTYRVVIIG